MTTYRDLAGELRALAEQLDEASFELLHDAVSAGATQRPDEDKVLTQARRAIEKAATLLERLSADADPD